MACKGPLACQSVSSLLYLLAYSKELCHLGAQFHQLMRSCAKQVLTGGKRFDCPEPNPFAGEENEELASVAYK